MAQEYEVTRSINLQIHTPVIVSKAICDYKILLIRIYLLWMSVYDKVI